VLSAKRVADWLRENRRSEFDVINNLILIANWCKMYCFFRVMGITIVARACVMDLNRIIQIRPDVWCKVSGIVIRSVLSPFVDRIVLCTVISGA